MKSELRVRLIRLEEEVKLLRSEVTALRARQRQLAYLAADFVKKSAPSGPNGGVKASQFADMMFSVVGGQEAAGDFDECAAVGRLDAVLGCSGVLVSPGTIVTAGHCGQRGRNPDPNAAALPLNDLSELTAAEVNPGTFIAHPKFTGVGAHDIAVLVLDRDCVVLPVPLASTNEMIEAAEVTVAGFGKDDYAAIDGFGVKRSAKVPIQFLAGSPNQTIPASIDPSDCFDPQLEFIVGSAKAGPCKGDSGGPVYIDIAGNRKVAGIVSRPPQKQTPICKGLTICTRIDVFASWIEAQKLPLR